MSFNCNTATLPQWLILMKGHPGIGKSTLARALSRHLCWPLVGKDHMRYAQQSIGLIHPGPYDPKDPIGEALYNLSYEITWTIAEQQLDLGLSVIIDSPLAHEQLFLRAQTIASGCKAFLGVVEINMDKEEHKQRVKLRASSPDIRPKRFCQWEEVESQLNRYGGCWTYNIPEATKLMIDGSMEQNCQIEMILQWIHRRSFGSPIKALQCATLNQIDTRSCQHPKDTLECEARDIGEDKTSELTYVEQQKPPHSNVEEHEFCALSLKRASSPSLQPTTFFGINSEVSSTTATSRANSPPREEGRCMIPCATGLSYTSLPRCCANCPSTGSDVSSTITMSRAISPPHEEYQIITEQTKVAWKPIPVQAELAYCDMKPSPSMRERMLEKLGTSRNGGTVGLDLCISNSAAQSALVGQQRLRQRSQSPPQPQLPQLGAPPNKSDFGGVAQSHMSRLGPETKVVGKDEEDTEDEMPPLQPLCRASTGSSAVGLDVVSDCVTRPEHRTSMAADVKDDNEFLGDRTVGRQVWRAKKPEFRQVVTHGQPQQIARPSRSVSWAPDFRKPRSSGNDGGNGSSSSKNSADIADIGCRRLQSSKQPPERRGGLRGSRASTAHTPAPPSSVRTQADETTRGNTPLSARRRSGTTDASSHEDTSTPSLRRRCALRGSRAALATTPCDRGQQDEAARGNTLLSAHSNSTTALREGTAVWTSRVPVEETRTCMPSTVRRVILSRHASTSPDDTGSRVWKSPSTLQSSRTARSALSPSNQPSETYSRGLLEAAHGTSSEAIKKGTSSSGCGSSFKHSSLRGAKSSKPPSTTATRVLPTAAQYRR